MPISCVLSYLQYTIGLTLFCVMIRLWLRLFCQYQLTLARQSQIILFTLMFDDKLGVSAHDINTGYAGKDRWFWECGEFTGRITVRIHYRMFAIHGCGISHSLSSWIHYYR